MRDEEKRCRSVLKIRCELRKKTRNQVVANHKTLKASVNPRGIGDYRKYGCGDSVNRVHTSRFVNICVFDTYSVWTIMNSKCREIQAAVANFDVPVRSFRSKPGCALRCAGFMHPGAL